LISTLQDTKPLLAKIDQHRNQAFNLCLALHPHSTKLLVVR